MARLQDARRIAADAVDKEWSSNEPHTQPHEVPTRAYHVWTASKPGDLAVRMFDWPSERDNFCRNITEPRPCHRFISTPWLGSTYDVVSTDRTANSTPRAKSNPAQVRLLSINMKPLAMKSATLARY